jgi:hypothetical protein
MDSSSARLGAGSGHQPGQDRWPGLAPRSFGIFLQVDREAHLQRTMLVGQE